jgi:hypothetical protein
MLAAVEMMSLGVDGDVWWRRFWNGGDYLRNKRGVYGDLLLCMLMV